MLRLAPSLRTAFLLAAGSIALSGGSPGSDNLFDPSLKRNLDLPYDAVGEQGENENVPERIVFYGQTYEATAIVWALDESGSMKDDGRWTLQMQEVTRAINELGKDAQFGVVFYGSAVTVFRRRLSEATAGNKSAAVTFVQSRRPAGDTCIGEGVVRALKIVRTAETDHMAVIVTSDGLPDNCATGDRATAAEVQQIYQQTLAANPDRKVRVHTVWVGRSQDNGATSFLRTLAKLHGGTFRMVSQ